MPTCPSRLHKLSYLQFWTLCTEYFTSRVKTKSYFKEQPVYRCQGKKWGDSTIFSKYSNLHYYKRLVLKFNILKFKCFKVMVSGNESKYCNVIESCETVFQRFQDYFPILRKACFLYYFRATLERLAFSSS